MILFMKQLSQYTNFDRIANYKEKEMLSNEEYLEMSKQELMNQKFL